MTIERGDIYDDGTYYDVFCDGCDETYGDFFRTFDDVVLDLKQRGWIPVKDGNDWTHFCPQCRHERTSQTIH